MSLTPDEIRALREPVEGRWNPYFTVHGDPFVVPADNQAAFLYRIADVSVGPADYGRDNARLLAAAPDLADTALALYERIEALEAVVRALTESDPCEPSLNAAGFCALCDQRDHAPSCPWRQARELTEGA